MTLAVAACSSSASSGETSSGAPPGPDDGGGGGDGTTPHDGGPSAGSGACSITRKGTAGLVLKGRVLAPAGPLDGEVLVAAAGTITCAGASCAASPGYADATVATCTGVVIAPGLINAHDHTDYNAQQRWQHRHGWRTGAGGETALPKYPSTTDPKTIAAAELRFVVGGATAVNSSGGVPGLLRNVASFKDKTQLEGLTGPSVFFDTFPLGDSNGTELATGCGYPSIRAAGTAFAGGGAYSPHISEGVNAAAENEFTCLKPTLVTAQTAIIHAVGLTATDVGTIADAKAKVIWS